MQTLTSLKKWLHGETSLQFTFCSEIFRIQNESGIVLDKLINNEDIVIVSLQTCFAFYTECYFRRNK